MRYDVFIDLLYQQINGGRASTDASVTKAQLRAFLPSAVNYALTGDYWANMRMEGDREVPAAFITELEARQVAKDDRGRDFLPLPEVLSNIGGNGGIRFVQDGAGHNYSPRPQGTSPGYWDCVLTTLREFQHTGKKIFIYNRPALVEKFHIGVILDSSMLKGDDELPIPSDQMPTVIDIMTAFFKDQRVNPKDYIINGVDPVNAAQNG